MKGGTQISVGELVRLCALDNELFCKTFFPNAVRTTAPSYARDVWSRLENPANRYCNLKIFRGGFKTTTLRLFTAKRVAYGLSHTILYVGASEAHAVRSIQWLKARIEPSRGADGLAAKPPFFASVFDLKPGRKWTENEIEVYHGTDTRPIWILGVGITGNLRGINFDDYRPDLIVLDDIVTDENAATDEQREKITNLVLGALKNSLAPVADAPNAKMVLLQTPIDARDVAAQATKDPSWDTAVYPCWTMATVQSGDTADQESSWPEQFPSEQLRKEKLAAVAQNRLSIFAREMECRLAQQELRDFRVDWLKFYDEPPNTLRGTFIMGIDPVPPPSPKALAENMAGRDYEAHCVWCRTPNGYYLVDVRTSRGHEPSWSVATALSLALQWRVSRIVVETVLYQRVLKWHLEKEMQRRKTYFIVKPYEDKRKKYNRITSVFGNLAPQGQIFVRKEHAEFVRQFEDYHGGDHDDVLDASAIALSDLVSPYLELGADEWFNDDADVPKLEVSRLCP